MLNGFDFEEGFQQRRHRNSGLPWCLHELWYVRCPGVRKGGPLWAPGGTIEPERHQRHLGNNEAKKQGIKKLRKGESNDDNIKLARTLARTAAASSTRHHRDSNMPELSTKRKYLLRATRAGKSCSIPASRRSKKTLKPLEVRRSYSHMQKSCASA